jgi:hypothetical protein
MRLEPGFWPNFGVTANEVSSQTGISTGICAPHVAPAGITISCDPSQQTCCPAVEAVLTDWLRGPMKFCLFAILTHLNGIASAPFEPGAGMVELVKDALVVKSWPAWLFDPQGPVPETRTIPVYFSQQS